MTVGSISTSVAPQFSCCFNRVGRGVKCIYAVAMHQGDCDARHYGEVTLNIGG